MELETVVNHTIFFALHSNVCSTENCSLKKIWYTFQFLHFSGDNHYHSDIARLR
jgi:hypothetical protein